MSGRRRRRQHRCPAPTCAPMHSTIVMLPIVWTDRHCGRCDVFPVQMAVLRGDELELPMALPCGCRVMSVTPLD
jgi:hypothetical protein